MPRQRLTQRAVACCGATWQAGRQQAGTATPGFAERAEAFAARQDQIVTATVRQRIGQGFFREMILTAYGQRCALTGLEDARLITASHIVGWAQDPGQRLNPRNGIALNALHDRAFDRHLISFDEDYRMMIAADVPPEARRQLQRVESDRLTMPERSLPDPALMERHRRTFHARQL